jgi:hypothetical protein
MRSRITGIALACILAFCLGPAALHAQSKPPEPTQKLALPQGPYDIGVIFNTSNILLGLESYQAGLGAKIGRGDMAIRGVLDIVLNGSSGSFSAKAGAAYQYYPTPGTIRPYLGGSLALGFMHQRDVISMGTLSIAPIAGIELFPLDFLSVFAEYAVTLDLSLSKDLTTSLTSFDYLLDTGLGNNSRIGIVIYLMRAGKKK